MKEEEGITPELLVRGGHPTKKLFPRPSGKLENPNSSRSKENAGMRGRGVDGELDGGRGIDPRAALLRTALYSAAFYGIDRDSYVVVCACVCKIRVRRGL